MANLCNIFTTILCYFTNCHSQDYPFRNPNLPVDTRVNDLVSRLTIDEVILQLAKGGAANGGPAPGIPRLGIKPYQWNTECLRGDPQAGNATGFPQALALASSWSPDLLHAVAEATSIEVRAKHNDFAQHGNYGDHTGLSCFSPVINIMRHPLWGRNQETYGEDPYLTGILGKRHVQGLHGDHPRYVRTSSGCKHFNVHGGPEIDRMSFNAEVSDRDWALTFQPAFKTCVESGVYSVMCSYNAINGVPACINKRLLTDILRREWGFKGYVVSDEGAIEFIMSGHEYLSDPVEVAARCLEAGTNLELSVGRFPFKNTYLKLKDAVNKGRISKDLLYERAKPLFYTRMKLGEFDPVNMNPYNRLNLSQVLTKKHQELARSSASQSFVLLKNLNFLPVTTKVRRMAVVGPMANNSQQLFGDYNPEPDSRFVVTPLMGIRKMATNVSFASGCNYSPQCEDYDPNSIQRAIQNVDLIIVCLGTGPIIERETLDRKNMKLPGHQEQLLLDAMKSSSPIILLLFSSGPLDIERFSGNNQIKAIFQCGFPAQAAGLALYDTLTLRNSQSNPAARLPYTWYKSSNTIEDIRNYTMHERTYRYFTGEPLYPFGYGLSYTSFFYSNLTLNQPKLPTGKNLTVQVRVKNIGHFDGDEVIQVYMKWLNYKALHMPQIQLVGFKRVHIKIGQIITVRFTVTAIQMGVWDRGQFHEVAGPMKIFAGGQQPNQRAKVESNVLEASFEIVNREAIMNRNDDNRFERL